MKEQSRLDAEGDDRVTPGGGGGALGAPSSGDSATGSGGKMRERSGVSGSSPGT